MVNQSYFQSKHWVLSSAVIICTRCGINADLSVAVQHANASSSRASGETYDDIRSALLHWRDKTTVNLTKTRREMKNVYDRRRKVAKLPFKVGDPFKGDYAFKWVYYSL